MKSREKTHDGKALKVALWFLEIFSLRKPLIGGNSRRSRKDEKYSKRQDTKLRHEPLRYPTHKAQPVHNKRLKRDGLAVPSLEGFSDQRPPTGSHGRPRKKDDRYSTHHERKHRQGSFRYHIREAKPVHGLRLASDSDESFESDNDANENQTHSVDNVEEDPGKKPGNPLEGHSSTSSRTSSDEALSEGKIFTDSSISHEDQVQVVDAEVAPETSYSVAVPVSPTPSLDSAAQAFSAEGSPWSEGCIAFIRFKKCSSCPSGFRRMTTAARNHQDKEHRGEKHPFVIVKIIQEDDGSTPRVQGYTGTTLGQRGRLSRKERKDYLSLEGGQNRFISCIENGQRIRSQEEPDLFIQGKEKMSRETYIEFRDLKSFPIDQLILYNNKLLQLEPESLDKLLNIV